MASTPLHAAAPVKAATLHDVARVAGVSLITASRALTNPKLVSDTTIAKVQAAADAVGYIPNLLAGGLKSKRSLMVAGLVPTISVAQFLPTVQTLTEALSDAGYQLILGQTGYDPKLASANTPEAVQSLMLVFLAGPIAFVALGAFSLLGYGLTPARAAETRRQLDARDAALMASAGADSLTGEEHTPPQRA